jgi:hypothetical protein
MSAKNITVVATFEAKPGKENELKRALLTLIAPTRKENGCINRRTNRENFCSTKIGRTKSRSTRICKTHTSKFCCRV